MQVKLIALAVREACQIIGQQYQQRQYIAQMAEAVQRGRAEKEASA